MVDEADAFAAWQAVHYVVDRNIEGALVECGVWRGGVSILMAQCLLELAISDREQYLYDTFEGAGADSENGGSVLHGWVKRNGWDVDKNNPDLWTRYLDCFYFSVTTLTTVSPLSV